MRLSIRLMPTILVLLSVGTALVVAQEPPDGRRVPAGSAVGKVIWQYDTGG